VEVGKVTNQQKAILGLIGIGVVTSVIASWFYDRYIHRPDCRN